MIFTHSYKQQFYPDSLTFEMSKESGRIYTKAMNLNKKERKNFKQIEKEMQEYVKKNSKYLQSQTAQASYQSFIINLKSYFKALKEFKKDPSKFSGEPKPPHKPKFLYKLTFKKSAIRYKNGELLLSTKKPHEPIRVKWANVLPIPLWVIINYDRFEGWSINFIMEKECKELILDQNKVMSIDLGVKRIATTFDGKSTITYSGKEIMSLVRLRNKVDAETKNRISRYKKKSREYNKLQRAKRKVIRRIKNKEKDILHKYSRQIVNNAIENKISEIVIGNNSSTHNHTDTGKENQKLQQNPEQKLRKFVQYKFKSVGGTSKDVPEEYTSRTCPQCNNVKNSSPKGRTYSCNNIECNFAFDRDGVGAINIYHRNVSFDHFDRFDHLKWLDVVGGLTPPIGVKYHRNTTPRLSLILVKNKMIDSVTQVKESIGPFGLEEPHEL